MANKDQEVTSNTEEEEKKGSFTTAEEKARTMGHRSKEEWVSEGKDADAWVDAGEFLRRAPLYEGLHKANRANKNLEKKLALLMQHQDELVQAKVNQQLAALKEQKKNAANENDVAKVVAIDEEIEKVKETAKASKASVASADSDAKEAFEEWKADNSWYADDKDMFAYANGIGSEIEKEHGPNSDEPWTHSKILKEVTKRTLKTFEWKLKNPARDAVSKVASTKSNGADTSGQVRNKLPTYNDLPKEAQELYREFVKTDKNPRGFMTKEKYLRDYALKAGLIHEEDE